MNQMSGLWSKVDRLSPGRRLAESTLDAAQLSWLETKVDQVGLSEGRLSLKVELSQLGPKVDLSQPKLMGKAELGLSIFDGPNSQVY